MMNRIASLSLLLGILVFGGCSTFVEHDPLPTVPRVNIENYMGKWYVLAAMPTLIDDEAYNAVQTYRLTENGVQINYSFLQESFDGDTKTYESLGRIDNPVTNADWEIKFMWPIKMDYKILYLEDDYSRAVVGHPNRKYAWILSRSPDISDTEYSNLALFLQDLGYDLGRLRRVPQNWN